MRAVTCPKCGSSMVIPFYENGNMVLAECDKCGAMLGIEHSSAEDKDPMVGCACCGGGER